MITEDIQRPISEEEIQQLVLAVADRPERSSPTASASTKERKRLIEHLESDANLADKSQLFDQTLISLKNVYNKSQPRSEQRNGIVTSALIRLNSRIKEITPIEKTDKRRNPLPEYLIQLFKDGNNDWKNLIIDIALLNIRQVIQQHNTCRKTDLYWVEQAISKGMMGSLCDIISVGAANIKDTVERMDFCMHVIQSLKLPDEVEKLAIETALPSFEKLTMRIIAEEQQSSDPSENKLDEFLKKNSESMATLIEGAAKYHEFHESARNLIGPLMRSISLRDKKPTEQSEQPSPATRYTVLEVIDLQKKQLEKLILSCGEVYSQGSFGYDLRVALESVVRRQQNMIRSGDNNR